jgi:O-antigen/teichoic acid export membrane protein
MSAAGAQKTTDLPAAPVPDSLAASVLVMFAAAVLQRAVGFGRSVVFCRWLDADQLGQWDLSLGFLMLAAPVAVLSLPGTFGRYAEHYRQRDQLRTFLRRVMLVIGLLSAFTGLAVYLGRDWLSTVIFATPDCGHLVTLLAATLVALIHYRVVIELFTALRLQRVASGLALLNVILFAVSGTILLLFWERTAQSVILSFGLAALLTTLCSATWLARCWRSAPQTTGEQPSKTAFWSKLLRFALWLWLINWLANLFVIADRYMIMHYSGLPPADAVAVVGQYHTARIVPLLLLNGAAMLATVVTPHLTRMWEAGGRQAVRQHLNLLLKSAVFGLSALGVLFLLASPLLFDLAFAGRFSTGKLVLPWTLMTAIYAGALVLAQLNLVCAERMSLSGVALAIGLAANIGLNLVLLPRYGLPGAVIGTCIAHVTALAIVLMLSRRLGMRWGSGTWLMLLCPLAVLCPPWLGLSILAVVGISLVAGNAVFDTREKSLVITTAGRLWRRLPVPRIPIRSKRLENWGELNG